MSQDERTADGAPDPERVTTPEDFGRELTAAKERSGLTIRQIARSSGVPASTVHDYLRGSHLPLPSNVGPLLKILSLTAEGGERHTLWIEALNRVRRTPVRRAGAPYRGLSVFQTEDAAWFFGREALTDVLVERLADPAEKVPLLVVGASGSGKSSLLRAGLIPRLLADGRETTLITPGAVPVEQLRAKLFAAAARSVVVVDQFEEIFASDVSEAERAAFIRALLHPGRPRVVLGMRADFYLNALRYPELLGAIQNNQLAVAPMTEQELRRAIVEPARKSGTDVEPALVDVLLRELSPTVGSTPAAHDIGALPLLSHALLATWERSRGRRLTVADYVDSGGIRDAIAVTAENAFAALSATEQEATRRLMLRLVRVSPDAPDTRRVVSLAALRQDGSAEVNVAEIVERFVDQRLLTADGDDVLLAHEALITAWPRLKSWLSADREGLLGWRRISEAADRWNESGLDPHELLRGARLAIARDWATRPEHEADLAPLERDFLRASIEREAAEHEAARRGTRRLRRLVGALTVLTLVAGGLAAYAQTQRDAATSASQQAMSRATAVRADQLRSEDTATAAQLSVAAYRMSSTADSRASLIESTGTATATRLLGANGIVQAVALGGSIGTRRVLAAAYADGTAQLWDVTFPGRPVRLGGSLTHASATTAMFAVAINSAGDLLAVGGGGQRTDGIVELWSIADPSRPEHVATLRLGLGDTVYAAAFDPEHATLAVGSADGSVRRWDVTNPSKPSLLPTLKGPGGAVQSLEYSRSAGVLVAGTASGSVQLWSTATSAAAHAPQPLGKPLTGPTNIVYSVDVSPDGRTLAAGSRDGYVYLWDIGKPDSPHALGAPIHDATSWVNAVAFSLDGTSLAVGSSDDDVQIWNVQTRSVTATLPHPGPVASLAWLSASALVTGDADYVTRIWHLPTPILPGVGIVNTIAYTPNSNVMAVGSDTLQLWSTVTRQPIGAAIPGPGQAETAAFSPDGRYLAVGYSTGVLRIWRVEDQYRLGSIIATLPVGAHSYIESVAFGADGHIATGSDDGIVRLWSVGGDGTVAQTALSPRFAGDVFSVAFNESGTLLAAGSEDDTARLWHVGDGTQAQAAGGAITGPTNYVYGVAFNPAGTILAIGSADRTVRLLGTSTPDSPTALATLTGPANYVYAVAFSPDGRTLAAGSTDKAVWLWDVSNPRIPSLIASVTGASGHIYTVAFSPDGSTLAAGGADSTTRLWILDPQRAISQICAVIGDPLTRTEWGRYVPGTPYRQPCASG
ncbi:PD40 domain-containing protein [Actinospica sp. MGRD01-02]|uniref:PD40 domain-containing protein n=1 Tax=Actinospica acidithermotolerans TaxID=2828514 RepID=A0A941ILB5_9ACTN|nr:helix-turn-helix domain-containing protein [Actinospica acidithermotolerans]MBR7829842.1 PD40 domain-containing protein [Actinospica acidithermotolerans]